ncbi:MAG TPA: RHS repeat-associated core domain-containing protein [Thermoanaerobaculia bacterium]|nr:RHS repeat-associated core domain-containing protein [Thermoanaerobaculia bacterium]
MLRLPALLLAFLAAVPAGAQDICSSFGSLVTVGFDPSPVPSHRDPANCACTMGCKVGLHCYPPELDAAAYEIRPAGCNPKARACTVRATVSTTFPGNSQGLLTPGSGARLDWRNSASSVVGSCGYLTRDIFEDQGGSWIETGFSCAGGSLGAGAYSLLARVCITGCTNVPANQRQMTLPVDLSAATLDAMFCKKPPAHGCPGEGPAGACCLGPGGGTSPGGGGPGTGGPGTGPQAYLYYLAGGVGNPDFPGAAAWTPTLGRYWSHDYAERIVLDPTDAHVWLITRYGTFAEFSSLSAGAYGTARPTDEYRKLFRTASGWELRDLDGTVQSFDASGRWSRTADKNGNAKVAAYTGGPLTRVTLPDGRREDFFYHPTGKLAEIREIGVDGATQRSWLYSWTGNDLVRIDRPDGRALEFRYDDPRFPGYMTRRDLIGTGLSRRVEAAWELDASGNVSRTWKGDPVATGPNAVEVYTLAYTNPALPTKATVTDPLGKVTTYTLARDSGSNKPKVTKIEGDCPTCGLGPNVQITYGDPAHPLLPTRTIDGRGLETQSAWNASGRMTAKSEAVGTPLARTTTYQYGNAGFPAFPTRIERPSTSGGAALRTTVLSYDAAGDLETRTVQGAETGSSFSYATATTFNAAGQPLTVDPPGHGMADVTSSTYDPARGNLLPLTRTDPLVGATSFSYDAFNRRTSVTDPNGVQTVTAYDGLDRVTSVTQKGAAPAGDLATTYAYTPFGDLLRTTLPRGNVVEYAYDAAGRLTSIERKPDAATRGERTVYTLDAYGHRTKEELQRWNGTGWVTDSFTDSVYSSRCHLDKVVHPGGAATEYAYDCDGNLEKVWDANHPRATNPNPTQLYAFDSLNRLSAITQAWTGAGGGNALTAYGYDIQDHLTRVTDAEGNATNYTYSDRDLMTSQVSPASGTTAYAYDAHGELTTETDARGVVVTRTVDPLDRLTAAAYPDSALNIAYTYDDPAVPFSKGRLTRITRHGAAVDYRYDRFGRLLQDGDLTYGYDANGNPSSLVYPGGVEAVTTFDYADRPATLLVRRAGHPDQPLVNAAAYLSSGPLASLTLGNGLAETRAFTQRYFPAGITLGSLLGWTYSTDAVGNISSIADTLNAANNRAYGYQDVHYFLTRGDGPWGPRAWTYDKIGNRLTESRAAATDTYSYVPNGAAGHTPILSQVQPAIGAPRTYQFGPAGHLDRIATGSDATAFRNDAASRLSAIESSTPQAGVIFLYDGRDYLSLADAEAIPFFESFETGNVCAWSAAIGLTAAPVCTAPPPPKVQPTYSSDGLLHALTRNAAPQRSLVFHFAGRPVAQLDVAGTAESWKWLTTDHLGTPIMATGTGGSVLWQGGFEPFGADWSGAGGAGVFLRLPGQWEDSSWTTRQSGFAYNLHRWYATGTGRYARPDPLGIVDSAAFSPRPPQEESLRHLYAYADLNPLLNIDPLGLKSRVCCKKIPFVGRGGFRHCYVEIEQKAKTTTCGLIGGIFSLERGTGEIFKNNDFDTGGDCGDWNDSCEADQCVVDTARGYANPSEYRFSQGPNSNTFAGTIARKCGLSAPSIVGLRTPGWNDPPASAKPGKNPAPVTCSLP